MGIASSLNAKGIGVAGGGSFVASAVPKRLLPMPENLPPSHLTLRDELALERTTLANERNFAWLNCFRRPVMDYE